MPHARDRRCDEHGTLIHPSDRSRKRCCSLLHGALGRDGTQHSRHMLMDNPSECSGWHRPFDALHRGGSAVRGTAGSWPNHHTFVSPSSQDGVLFIRAPLATLLFCKPGDFSFPSGACVCVIFLFCASYDLGDHFKREKERERERFLLPFPPKERGKKRGTTLRAWGTCVSLREKPILQRRGWQLHNKSVSSISLFSDL